MRISSDSRVVLVTGAAKRLGREIALACAKAGWRVAVHYRGSEVDAIETVALCADSMPATTLNESQFHYKFQADLSDEAATRGLAAQVIAHMGRLDAVVNSAALFEHDAPETFSYAAMQKHLASNTGAAILLAQALHAHVKARGDNGVVVNMLDQKLWNQNPDFLSYTLSKAALESANTMLAMGLAPQVRVVGVAPGLTLTSHMLEDDKFQALHKLSPLGRSSTPEDVCAAVLFALTNSSITGTTLLVDGGQHLMKFDRDFSLM
ncbi:SDR family oxidoreductase [Variovorax sp. PCZ-1]|uniref:SDR family oxidoreductase n=1 Tax=Variovorax sp. PCZ-1 TaxID=2835533 RepID=UPI001BCF72A7|nr:SDR family oxidoreductase [Variovorax sp. PCZ-1]MBS7808128.1 SDR family oxidoreductase [Variovorax sp. PCZ-1]